MDCPVSLWQNDYARALRSVLPRRMDTYRQADLRGQDSHPNPQELCGLNLACCSLCLTFLKPLAVDTGRPTDLQILSPGARDSGTSQVPYLCCCFSLFKLYSIYLMYVNMCACTCSTACMWRSECRTGWRWVSSIMWVPGIQLRFSGSTGRAFTL